MQMDAMQWIGGAEINRQGARMTAIASLSTDDWRLAEAEYLLRLASQRLAMQQSDNVLPLLTRADTILRALVADGYRAQYPRRKRENPKTYSFYRQSSIRSR